VDHDEAVRTLATEKYLLGEMCLDLRQEFEMHLFDCEQCAFDLWAAVTFWRTPKRFSEKSLKHASVQKSMTAVAVLQLVEKGRIDLDAEVQNYVPFYPRKQFPITIRQLRGHLGGIPHYVNRDVEQHFKDHKDIKQTIAVFANFDLVVEPGRKFVYSSYGYNLLGTVIEGASGESYPQYMEKQGTCRDDEHENG
jgi:Beta-lactamase